jgi:putative ABC transport system ATP-binding protein
MEIIKIKNLRKVFNPDTVPVVALDDINLTFKKGVFTAIVGPSGSGKTTLLNMIGGIDAPTHGSVMINNNEITKLPTSKLVDYRKDNIGFVFQDYSLMPVLTALENVEFVMQLQGIPERRCRDRAIEILNAFDLQDKINEFPAKLSGGQQQRVAVARALAPKPKFILADEPTANLDSVSAGELLDIMELMNKKEGTTFIFSTHDERVIKRAKRIIKFNDGKIAKK